jgi:hypothetical protein
MSPSTLNIACASPACTNPVIGQCGGYKSACGRFYCATHSANSLCAECAFRNAADDKAEQFRKSAEQVEREHSDFTWKRNELYMIGLALGLFPA